MIDYVLKNTNCPICNSKKSKLLYNKVREFSNKGPVVRKCKCGCIYLNPVMTEKSYFDFYNNNEQRLFVEKKTNKFYKNINKSVFYRICEIKKFLKNKNINNIKLVDVGSGMSNFSFLFKEMVKNVDCSFGLEPSTSRADFSIKKGVDVLCNDIYDKKLDKLSPNIITLFHVLEHIQEPYSFLNRIYNVLDKDGFFIVEVPNHNDILVKLEKYKNFYYQNAHCLYFTPKVLKNLLKRNGFDVIKEKKIQRYSLDNHLNWLIKGKPGSLNIYKKICMIYNFIIKIFNLNDTILIICKKNKI